MRMAEPNPDVLFIAKLMDERENAKPLEQRFEERRKIILQNFRDWTDDGWARGWQRTNKVPPADHANIIYWHAMGVGMVELSLGYKLSSSTVFGHIHAHNTQVAKHGACERCIRAFRNIPRDADIICLVESEVTLGSELKWELEVLSKASRDEEWDLMDDRYNGVEQRYWLARSSGSIE
jgi:hypothetical protein